MGGGVGYRFKWGYVGVLGKDLDGSGGVLGTDLDGNG